MAQLCCSSPSPALLNVFVLRFALSALTPITVYKGAVYGHIWMYIWIGDHQVSRQNMSGMFQMTYLSDTKDKAKEFECSRQNLCVSHHLTHISTLWTIPTVNITVINQLTRETPTVMLKTCLQNKAVGHPQTRGVRKTHWWTQTAPPSTKKMMRLDIGGKQGSLTHSQGNQTELENKWSSQLPGLTDPK